MLRLRRALVRVALVFLGLRQDGTRQVIGYISDLFTDVLDLTAHTLDTVAQGIDAVACRGNRSPFGGIHQFTAHAVGELSDLFRVAETLDAFTYEVAGIAG
jgi:hypothetical protein